MQLILDTNGLTLSKRNASFYVTHKTKGRRLISPHRVSSIAVFRDCLISTAALRLAAKHSIPVFFCSATAKAEAALYAASYANITTLRRQQVLWAETAQGTALMIEWLGLKTANQIQHLRQLKSLSDTQKVQTIAFLQQQFLQMGTLKNKKIEQARQQLLGLEGSAAKIYWQAISAALPESWRFEGRSRRPALDFFNCLLNYLYGMTYNVVENAIRDMGLDPYFGFFHVDGHQRPTLVFDMIEPFRPWIDQLLTTYILQNPTPRRTYFQKKDDGWWLSKIGRQYFIPLYNDYMAEKITWQDYTTSRRNHIHRLAGLLSQQLKNDLE